MFLQASVILSTGGVYLVWSPGGVPGLVPEIVPGRHPSGPSTPPWTRHTPQDQVPPGPGNPLDQVHPPGPGTPPRTRYTPQDQVPPETRYTPWTRYTHLGPGTPPDQVPPGTKYTPRTKFTPRTKYTYLGLRTPPTPGLSTPPPASSRLWNKGNECILVFTDVLALKEEYY